MSKLESLDPALFQPVQPEHSERVLGGLLLTYYDDTLEASGCRSRDFIEDHMPFSY